MARRLSRRATAGLLACPLLAIGCSSSAHDNAATSGGHVVRLKVRDFAIEAPRTIAAGKVVFDVSNSGPDMHELILVRADGRPLPLRPDDLTLDEDAFEPRTVSIL